jgi:hypothetical protein
MTKKWWELPGITFLMLALAVVSTYPLILHFNTGIPYAPFGGEVTWNRSGDQIQLLYWFWLVKENFMGVIPFNTNPYEFNMLMAHETSGLNTIPLAFLYMLFSPLGDIAAYNCTILSSYVLAGLFMYLLVRLYSDSRAGALLSAIIFTFAPSRINGLVAGHGYGFLYFCYPFILFFLEKGIRSEKIRYGFLSSFGLICLSMLEPHLIYYICVFLGMYIPVRIIALFPVCQTSPAAHNRDGAKGPLSWSIPHSFIVLWGAGVAAIFYTQVLFSYRDQDPFFSPFIWWVLVIYPFIPVLIALCFASISQRLSSLDFRRSFAVEAGSFLPLYLLIPLSLLPRIHRPIDTAIIIVSVAVLVVTTKLFLLRRYLLSILKVLLDGLIARKNTLWPVIPVIISMGGIVAWIALAKVDKVASTIAGKGRTLEDVALFSSRLSDLFLPISNVYVGIVPAVLGGVFFLALLWSLFSNRQYEKFGKESELIAIFYFVVAFCCYILALGLAFGKSSLYILLYHYFPFFNYPRVSDRIITLVLFALAIVVGFVVKSIQQRCIRRVSLGVVILFVLAATGLQLKDYNILKPMGITILDTGQDIYTYVKENRGDGLLLEIPLWPGDSHQSSLYQHYIMLDRVPRVNGCSPMVLSDYIDTVFEPLAAINQGMLVRQQYDLLRQLGVKFITVHDNRDIFLEKVSPFAPLTTVRRLKNSPYLEFVDIQNSFHLKNVEIKNDNLYLFRLKSKEIVESDTEQSAWYEMPYFYGVHSRLHQLTGKVAEDKAIGKQVFQAIEGENKPGFLVYGPYDVYSSGEYRCYFTINTDASTEEDIARIEVASVTENGDQVVLVQTGLKGEKGNTLYKKVFLEFSLAEKAKLEFRVFYYGKGDVRVEEVAVYKANNDAPLYSLEAVKMVGDTGQLMLEKEASAGKVIEAIVGKSKKGDLVYGPNRIYSKGHYRARFYLRTKKTINFNKTDVAAVLSVTDEQNAIIFSQRNVPVMELNETIFTGVEVEFELTRDEELSFHVEFTGKASLQLDRIEIVRR